MCLFNSQPQQQAPQLPPEPASMQQPDGAAIKSAAQRRAGERTATRSPTILTSGKGVTQRASSNKPGLIPTILTSAAGVMNYAPTEKKTLLGA